jgi:hypothetical protein
MAPDRITTIEVSSHYRLSDADKEFVVQLANEVALERQGEVVLHDAWEDDFHIELVLSSPSFAISDIIDTIQSNIGFEVNISSAQH